MEWNLRKAGFALGLAVLLALVATSLLVINSRDVRVSTESIADMSVKENAAGFAQNIFIARVTESLGTRESYGAERTLFAAEVRETLKGDATGSVELSVLARVPEEPQFQVGKYYLVASRTHDSGEFETVAVAHETPEGKLSPDERREWQEAIRNPTPYEDIVTGRAPTSGSEQ